MTTTHHAPGDEDRKPRLGQRAVSTRAVAGADGCVASSVSDCDRPRSTAATEPAKGPAMGKSNDTEKAATADPRVRARCRLCGDPDHRAQDAVCAQDDS